jgi:hypothetical protein
MVEMPKNLKVSFKTDQWLQRGFKQTEGYSKDVNSRPGWESQQHEWEIQQRNWNPLKHQMEMLEIKTQ